MKKIYIKEDTLSALKKDRLLPKFLFKAVKNHATSLGDNEAFPSGDDFPYDYSVLKIRYNEVCDNIEELNLESLDESYLMTTLSKLITECKEMEKPIRNELERICENALNRLFAIPKEMVNFKFKLVDKVTFKKAVRVKPEGRNETKYTFKDFEDIKNSNKVVEKRRFINALVQGASYTYARQEDLYGNDINAINPSLMELYRKIIAINDYLLFIKKEELSDDKPMQGSYVETYLGIEGEKSSIDAQGIIFPLLLQESIRGLFDLFSAHGLPSDVNKAKYVIKKADYLLAEPWDMRLGVVMWNQLFGNIDDTNVIPYVFTLYIKQPTDEFNEVTKEILFGTEKGKDILDSMVDTATYDSGYEAFTNRINAKNVNKSVISDSYFTAAELDGFDLDGEEESDVIEEDGNDNIETFYRGVGGTFDLRDFGVDKKYRCIWLAETPECAAEYASDYEDGHLFAIDVDMSRFNGYDWYEESDSYFDPYDGFSREVEAELMKEGYNGYTFTLDEDTVVVLFDPSLITNVTELPLQKYLEESETSSNDVIEEDGNDGDDIEELLSTASVDNIDFIEGDADRYGEKVLLSVDGVEIPSELVSLDFRLVNKTFPKGKKQLLNMDIELSPKLRRKGLGTKIYAKAVREFGAICSRFSTRHNDDGIRGIFSNLQSFEDIYADEVVYKNFDGETINDYYAILKSELPKYL